MLPSSANQIEIIVLFNFRLFGIIFLLFGYQILCFLVNNSFVLVLNTNVVYFLLLILLNEICFFIPSSEQNYLKVK